MSKQYYWWPDNFHCKGEKFESFWQEYLNIGKKRILYILGKGFDVRMNVGISKLISYNQSVDLDCYVVMYNEGIGNPSIQNQSLADDNFSDLEKILTARAKIHIADLQIPDGNHKIQGRRAAELFSNKNDVCDYTDIVVDISALPRNIYFPMISQLIKLCKEENLHVIIAENSGLDINIKARELDENANYMFSFSGNMELIGSEQLPIVWFPVLGEGKSLQLEIILKTIRNNLPLETLEICPILPFPAQNPRRVENLIDEYHRFLLEEFKVEPRNIIYAEEQNPFDVYRQIRDAGSRYDEAFHPLGGCRKVVSALSSKLLSLGALMAAQEGQMAVAYVGAQGYEHKFGSSTTLTTHELHGVWLTGEPYVINI